MTVESRPGVRTALLEGATCYYLTTLVAILGVSFGLRFIEDDGRHSTRAAPHLTDALAAWNGQSYVAIATQGYSYNPNVRSNVAFFPAYPLLGRMLAKAVDIRVEMALVIVSHVALLGAFVTLARYVGVRFATNDETLRGYALMSMGLFPVSCFFRVAYSEALFLLLAIVSLHAIQQRWPLLIVGAVVGLATASRPVGVALVPVFILYVWRESPNRATRLRNLTLVTPVACWGLLAFMGYQWLTFGNPFAFLQAQEHWFVRQPVASFERIVDLATLEPLASVYDPDSNAFWAYRDSHTAPWFSLHFANPVFFLLAIALVVLGAIKHWLNSFELVLSAFLLGIPYLTRAHEMGMTSMGRFVAVIFPLYLVLGQILTRLPAPIAAAVLAISAVFLALYSALFVAQYTMV